MTALSEDIHFRNNTFLRNVNYVGNAVQKRRKMSYKHCCLSVHGPRLQTYLFHRHISLNDLL